MNRRGKGEGSIVQRKDGSFMGRVDMGKDIDGKRKILTFYGKSRPEVSEKLLKALNEIKTGTFVEPSKITMDSWLQSWLTDYAKPSVKPSTYISYEMLIRQHLKDLGGMPLQEIRGDIIQKFYNDKLKNGRVDGKGGLSPKTIRNIHNMLHSSLEQAYKNGLVFKNVSDMVTLPRYRKPDIRVLSTEEQKRLVEAARKDRLGMAIILDLSTGLRIGELLALKWNNINMDTGIITIRQTINRLRNIDGDISIGEAKTSIVFDTPKTKYSNRTLPLQDIILEQLKSYKGDIEDEDSFVFTSRKVTESSLKGNPVEPRTMQDTFYRLCREAKISNANFHCLRHSFATRALEVGIPAKTVSEILGHSSVSFTLDVYSHVLPDIKKAAMEKLSPLFSC